jgi:hypothetical protein
MGAALPAFVSASRSGNTLNLTTAPFSDNNPGHVGNAVFSFANGKALESDNYAIYQNDVRIARGNLANGIKPVQLSTQPSVIKFVLSESRSGSAFPLSTGATTVWTWHSAPQPGATVPPNWFCGFSRRGLLRHCAVQPMMTLNYHVRGLPSDGRTDAGPQVISLDVGHIQPRQQRDHWRHRAGVLQRRADLQARKRDLAQRRPVPGQVHCPRRSGRDAAGQCG